MRTASSRPTRPEPVLTPGLDADAWSERPQASESRYPAVLVGLLLGAAAAVPGVSLWIGPLRLWHLLVIAALVVACFTGPPGAMAAYRVGRVEIAFLIFLLGSAVVETYNASSARHPVAGKQLVEPLFYLAAYVSCRLVSRSAGSLRVVLLTLTWPVVPLSALAVLQAFRVSAATDLVLAITDSQGAESRLDRGAFPRATGLVGHWTGFGAWLCVMTAVLLVVLWLGHNGPAARCLVGASLLACGIGIIATLTLAPLLIYLLLVAHSAVRFRVSAGAVVTGLIASGVITWATWGLLSVRLQQQFGDNPGGFAESTGLLPESVVYRMHIWATETIPAFLSRPLTGWGLDVYGDRAGWAEVPRQLVWPSAESQWLRAAMVGGLVGLALLVVLLGAAWGALAAAPRAVAPLRLLLLAVLVGSITVPMITNVGFPGAFWAAAGAIAGIPRKVPRPRAGCRLRMTPVRAVSLGRVGSGSRRRISATRVVSIPEPGLPAPGVAVRCLRRLPREAETDLGHGDVVQNAERGEA